ncbi:hypothetical protein BASA50_001260 [Batrachochytrium salamandrivorans]|uniref:UVR domain-containing protein n=1 Tax=Batrachochytrium salamandrivorans TaxID=1357716 RepID=A0ABQ8EVJ1_9FUNG|nr:hypothetical protein BASA60_005396 [Batrachochytrium salamandrivorans]KAH6587331.1 hypothetical protein BASA50_001260 [Batrachochytrium salamandrivorans]KAH6588766.1 hypothetical protein BASA61_005830 [Batrachochytrium salamandrivorans]KAH9250789.1 hypothetical protein BASA81_011377 [Batrachochytrium salamandrivorans]KAH9267281.1 hypothetical protein BASA83_010014 [Batrachochytrium salamandrivorans]
MRLGSFAMVSLLAITVSAWPPHNPDTQNMNPSPNDVIQNMNPSPDDAAQNSQQPHGFDVDMLDQLLNDITQNAQQHQDAGTQSVQQSPGATSQSAHQSQGISAENIQYFQEFDVEMLEEFLNDITQNMNQPQDAGTQNSQQPQDAGTQSVQQSPDAYAQSAHQYRDVSAQDGEQSQNYGTQMLEEFLDSTTQNAQQPQGAATHSAQQSPGSTSQDIHEFQGISVQDVDEVLGATSQSAQQLDQDIVMAEMNRLTEALKIQDDRCFQIDRQINTDKQRDTKARDMMKRIAMKLRETGLSSDKKLELKKTARNLRMASDELFARYKEQHQNHKDAMAERNEMYTELQILKGNQKLIAEHNSKNVAQVGLSPNSCYNIGILKKQYDDITKDIDKSSVKHKEINDAMRIYSGSVFRAESERLENEIHTLQNYNVVARRILCQHMNGQSIGAWISTFLDSYMHNIKI